MSEYYKTKESVNEYIKMAEGFNGKELIDELLKFLPLNSTLLEIGSGPGTDFEILNEYYNVVGSDFSKEFLKRLKDKFPKDEFLELNAENLTTQKKFNGIYSNKVLHHLTDEGLKSSVKSQSGVLNMNGIICHSFWKGQGTETYNGMFVNYHDKNNIELFFKDHFEILLLQEYKEFENNDSILFIGRKTNQ